MGKNKIKYIYWFAFYNLNSPSVRYRAQYPLDYFKKKYGIKYDLIIPGYSLKLILKFVINFISALFDLRRNSLIVIQKINSNFIYATLLKLLVLVKNNTVYDIDDADYLICKPKSIYFFARKCKIISSGSQNISAHLAKFNKNIIYTTSPIVDLNIAKTEKNKTFTVGWIGDFGGAHKRSLIELVFPAIFNLNFNIKFMIIGVTSQKDILFIEDYFRNKTNIIVETPSDVDWKNEAAIQKLIVGFDLGIATLINTEIQIAKSGIKAKQYMNNGIPVLSTNLPENNKVVINGINGFFCASIDDFQEKFIQFNKMDINEYKEYSINARNSISNFNHDNYFKQFELIYNGI